MRYIIKTEPPKEYTDWIKNKTVKNNLPDFYNVNGKCLVPEIIRDKFKNHAIKDQKGLCCYCCCSLRTNPSHFEHFEPRHRCKRKNRGRLTSYKNIFISCNGIINEVSTTDKEFCGHKKGGWFEEDKIISPTDSACEGIFTYTVRGEIKAKNDSIIAKAMIKNLNLCDPYLNIERQKALEGLGYFKDDFDADQAMKDIEREDEDGFLLPYYNILKYFCVNT